jgi:hypothetical protein
VYGLVYTIEAQYMSWRLHNQFMLRHYVLCLFLAMPTVQKMLREHVVVNIPRTCAHRDSDLFNVLGVPCMSNRHDLCMGRNAVRACRCLMPPMRLKITYYTSTFHNDINTRIPSCNMVFTPINVFRQIGINCPQGNNCQLTSCIFSHPTPEQQHVNTDSEAEPAVKKRKITETKAETKSVIKERIPNSSPGTLERPVSPPAKKTNSVANGKSQAANTIKQESLNPRIVPDNPFDYGARVQCLKLLYGEMVKRHEELVQLVTGNQLLTDSHKNVLLSEQELITLALDEEEEIARTNSKTYKNAISGRITSLKKMGKSGPNAWVDYVKTTRLFKAKERPPPRPKKEEGKKIETGLTPVQEVEVAKQLVASPEQLKNVLPKFGYITVPPTEKEANEAAFNVEYSTSLNHEYQDQ